MVPGNLKWKHILILSKLFFLRILKLSTGARENSTGKGICHWQLEFDLQNLCEVEGENQLHKISLWLPHVCRVYIASNTTQTHKQMLMHTHAHTHAYLPRHYNPIEDSSDPGALKIFSCFTRDWCLFVACFGICDGVPISSRFWLLEETMVPVFLGSPLS